jgi:hypothetical protein
MTAKATDAYPLEILAGFALIRMRLQRERRPGTHVLSSQK